MPTGRHPQWQGQFRPTSSSPTSSPTVADTLQDIGDGHRYLLIQRALWFDRILPVPVPQRQDLRLPA